MGKTRRHHRLWTALTAVVVGAMLSTGIGIAAAAPAAADDASGVPPMLQRNSDVVTADALPTVQIDSGYVWAQAPIGTTVYAVGQFSNARAPLAAPGTQLTPRSNILAFDINTGALLPFAPTVNGTIKAVAASPDGSRIYIGGSFTKVNGETRYSFAALDAATGALVPGFTPSVGGSGVYAISADGGTVYVGGLFTQANGTPRKNLASFNASNGSLLPWAPQTDLQVDAMVMDPAGQNVIAGGRFSQVNGDLGMRGLAAIDKVTGALDTGWQTPQTVQNGRSNGKAGIFGLSTDAHAVYGTGWVFADAATGNLEGVFAAEGGTGAIRWIADCLGDHYGVYSTGKTVYSTSHTHACSTMGMYPEQNPRTHRFLSAFTADARGTLGYQPATGSTYKNWQGTPAPAAYNWFPDLTTGTATGLGQAGLSITGVGNIISVAGEFGSANNLQYQGIVRYSTAPPSGAKDRPRLTGVNWVPTATSFIPGRVRVAIPSNWDRDDMTLTYELRRQGVATPVATASADSLWWNRQNLVFDDTTAVPGTSYSYTVVAKDGDGNAATSQAVSVTAASGTASAYASAVVDDRPQLYYPLGDVQQDWAGANNPVMGSGVAAGSPGIENSASGRSDFNGSSDGVVVSKNQVQAPKQFTTELWFRTTTTAGGKLIGYGNASSGSSGNYDRHVYMRNDGRLVFGVYPGGVQTVESSASFNDGVWHHVAASQSAAGMALYVDGELVGSNPSVTSAQDYAGYWRIGSDNLGGWPSSPSSSSFAGSIDEVAVYDFALSSSQLRNHYAIGKGFLAPTAAFTVGATGTQVAVDAGASHAAGAASITDYRWDFGDGSSPQTGATASHTYSTAGTYTVSLLVTDSNGSTASSTQQVVIEAPNAPPMAAFTASSQGLTATVDASASTDADGHIASYAWAWGDSTPGATDQVASHKYGAAGTYTVSLTVTDDRGATATSTQDVVVTHADPVANFTASTSGARVNVDGGSSSASDGASLAYDWNWGDGTAHGSGATASHTYGTAGEFDVTLTVTDALGGTHLTTQTVTVVADVYTASDAFGRTVVSGWGAADLGGTWTVQGGSATVASVSDGRGRLNIAPGGTRELSLPAVSVTDSHAQVTYTASGSPSNGHVYVGVGARYGSQGGYRAVAWLRSNGAVTAVVQRNGTSIASQPITGLTWSAGSTLHIASEVTGVSPTTIKVKVWLDGTAEPSTWQLQTTDSTAALQTAGSPTVYAYRPSSATGSSPISVDDFAVKDLAAPVVNVDPVAAFTSSVAGLQVSVDGSSSSDADGSVVSYAWDFGDGGSATGATATHPYTTAGTYVVTLTVTDDKGATNVATSSVTVTAPPVVNVDPVAAFTSSVAGLQVSVDGSSSSDADGSVVSYAWDFGDGGSATGATATHPYTTAGTYVVTLTVTDDKGATNVATSSVTVATTPGGGDPQPQPLADDSFDRSVSGGWGQATVGGSWKVSGGSASVASVAAGVGRLSLPAGSTRYVTLDETPLSDGTVTTQFTMSPAAATGASYIGVVARQASADRYMVRAWMRADGTVWLVASRGATVLGSQPLSGVTAVPDTSYSLTVSVTGGTTPSLSAKLWATGTAEPANWQLVATDGSGSPLSAGAFGVVAYRVSSATAPLAVAFDSFRVASAQ